MINENDNIPLEYKTLTGESVNNNIITETNTDNDVEVTSLSQQMKSYNVTDYSIEGLQKKHNLYINLFTNVKYRNIKNI